MLRLHSSDDERVFCSRQRRQHVPRRDVLKGGNDLARTWMAVIVYPVVAVQPARPEPICTSHGHTRSGGAAIVTACMTMASGSGIKGSTGRDRLRSTDVALTLARNIAFFLCKHTGHVAAHRWPGLIDRTAARNCPARAENRHPLCSLHTQGGAIQ